MEVRTLGRLGQLGTAAAGSVQGPPSSQAIVGLMRGEPGALGRVVGSTLLRSLLLAPGVGLATWLAGARGMRAAGITAGGALVSSLGITLFLAGYYMLNGTGDDQSAMLPPAGSQGNATIAPPAAPATTDPATLAQITQGAVQSAIQNVQQSTAMADTAMAGLRGAYRGMPHGSHGTGF